MTYNEMKKLAIFLTSESGNKIKKRDLYYDPKKKIFIHRPVSSSQCRYASAYVNGKSIETWINSTCIFIGRYEINVNPDWIIEDMVCTVTPYRH